jgi:integrase
LPGRRSGGLAPHHTIARFTLRLNRGRTAKADIEELMDWMLTSGRRGGGKPGTGLSGRSARLTLGRLNAALEAAVLEGKLIRNVAKLVSPPEHIKPERETWSKAEVKKFLAQASSDRLYAAWRRSLYGLRRGEVLGLRWSDIDLRASTLTVNQARVLVEYRIRLEEPKSRNGKRTLPLDGELVAALATLRKRQLDESAAAGAAYRLGLAGLDSYQGGEYVVTDEAGSPVHPEWYSDEFGRLLRRVGLRRITLHDSRHTTLTLMEHAGVPISIISKWAEHYDSAFTQKTYVHASDGDLQRGQAALARIHKIV